MAKPSFPEDNYPILLLSDVLTEELVRKHLQSLLAQEIHDRYGNLLPESVEPNVDQILEVVRGEFFRSANTEFSMNIAENSIGLILANSFGYEYTGEGLDAFLKGLRDSEKKRKN